MSTASTKKRHRDGAEPPKKRRREQQKNLCELNIDELYIIFAHIYPMDLLNLARTCKSLRAILMHKSSQFLWTIALRQIEGLPPCPPDLTEPEYTNLVFYPRCNGCGKPAQTILWSMRRRYCPDCRVARLCDIHSCDVVIELHGILPRDQCKVGQHGSGKWVERAQIDSLMREYHSSSDKPEFLNEKRKQFETISMHARKCEYWKKQKGRVYRHRFDLEELRKERRASIFNRLKQHGYAPEIASVRDIEYIEKSFKSAFTSYKPLTDSEWDEMWPEWVKLMNKFRERRLENTLYDPRRRKLVSEYNNYVTQPPPNTPIFELLPDVGNLESFPPFQDIIKAPEEVQTDGELFISAFLQLSVFVGEWKRQLDEQVAEMVKIPPHLSVEDMAPVGSGSVTTAGSQRTNTDKLRLACALFHTGGSSLFTYPEVFLAKPILDRYPSCGGVCAPTPMLRGIGILEEAPYIVHACGLDPNVATMDDMDQRNARLRCVYCEDTFVRIMDWRGAMLHAQDKHRCVQSPPSERWQLVSDEYIDAIMAVEGSLEKDRSLYDYRRCLLCQPRTGDVSRHYQVVDHIQEHHGVEIQDIERGVHYEHLGISDYRYFVVMVKEGEKVMFRKY